MTDALAKLSKATQMLAEAKTLDEIRQVMDLAEAARTYAQAAKLGTEAANHAAEIKLRAQRKAGEMLQQLERSKGGDSRSFQPGTSASEYRQVLTDEEIAPTTAHRWQQVASLPEEMFEAHIAEVIGDGKELTTSGMLREIRREISHNEKIDPPELTGKYHVIYADPPWSYDNSGFDQSAEQHYPTMTLDEIKAMPVKEIASTPCVLFLWATVPLLPSALEVMESWGFEYKTHRVWIKDKGPGIGWWLYTRHELLLIGTRNGNAHPEERIDSVIIAPAGKHSKKPDSVYSDIEQCYKGSKIELFARQARDGWTSWGNENV